MNARKWLRTEANRLDRDAKALEAQAKASREIAIGHRWFAKEGEQREVKAYVQFMTDPRWTF